MTTLLWDIGSAYDFFIALYVLHHPTQFGVRPTWAAGMRSRLPTDARALLERAQTFLPVPLAWLHSLPQPKEARTALEALAAIPAAERLPLLLSRADWPAAAGDVLRRLAAGDSPTPHDLETLQQAYEQRGHPLPQEALQALVTAISQSAAFGEAYLEALRAFWREFFHEEEAHLQPWLERGLHEAQTLAEHLSLAALLERLSGGVRFEVLEEAAEIVLVPSFWSTPLVFFAPVRPGCWLLVFGCRPPSQPLLPGEQVPEILLGRLKALADPTRLRILRYLAQAPETPSGLARRLRLRAPTVVHHLQALRLAGLVQITITREGERRYALRPEALSHVLDDLQAFLKNP